MLLFGLLLIMLIPCQSWAAPDSLCMGIDGSIKIIYYEEYENVYDTIWTMDGSKTDYVVKDTLIKHGNIRIITDSVDITLDLYSLSQEFNYEPSYSMWGSSVALIDTSGQFDLIVMRDSIMMSNVKRDTFYIDETKPFNTDNIPGLTERDIYFSLQDSTEIRFR